MTLFCAATGFLLGAMGAGCLPFGARAASLPPAQQRVEQALMRLHTAGARRLSAELPDAELAAFYINHAYFVEALATQDPTRVADYLTRSEQYLDRLATDQYRPACFAAEVHLERAILKGLDQRNLAAYFEMRRCHALVKELERRYPGRIDHQKLLGTFEAVVAAVPENYQWLARLLGFQSALQRGMARLERAAAAASWLRTEAVIATILARKQLLGQAESAQARLDSLIAAQPESPLLIFLGASALLDAKQRARAAQLLAAQPPPPPGEPIMPFLIYLRGRAALGAGQWAEARAHFAAFAAQPNPKLLRRAAQLRIGLTHALENAPALARAAMEATTRLPASFADEDAYALRQAKEYLARPYGAVELALLRARLAFDGGELQAALAELTPLERSAQKGTLAGPQLIETSYRLGRTHHELGQPELAERHYRAALRPDVPDRRWMRVYSLYYLATLAEARRDLGTARWYYEQALTYRGYDYRAGLEAKAKAALARLTPAK